jgi:hypothetical protein
LMVLLDDPDAPLPRVEGSTFSSYSLDMMLTTCTPSNLSDALE